MDNTTPKLPLPSGAIELDPAHIAYFELRGIDPAYAVRAGARSCNGEEAARLLGRPSPLPGRCLVLTYPLDRTGYVRVRPDEGEAAGARYLAPAGQSPPPYLAPEIDYQAADTVFVAESAVKAMAFTQLGLAAVGLAGVSTCLRNGELDDSWGELELLGKEVVIAFDANRATNPAVAIAEAKLERAFRNAGAVVFILELDKFTSDPAHGPDDFLSQRGEDTFCDYITAYETIDPVQRVRTAEAPGDVLRDYSVLARIMVGGEAMEADVRQAFRKKGWGVRDLNKTLKAFQAELRGKCQNSGGKSPLYEVVNGRLCKRIRDNETELVNCDIRLVEVIKVRDVFGEVSAQWELEADLGNGEVLTRRVEFDDLTRPGALTRIFGPRVEVYGMPMEVLTAVQHVSQGHYAERLAVRRTGWHSILGNNVFVHAGGSIGAETILPHLGGESAYYDLRRGDAPTALRSFLRVIGLASPSVSSALFAAVPAAVLTPFLRPQLTVFLHGRTGSLKTSIAHVVLAPFVGDNGARATIRAESTLPGTENSLLELRDVLPLVDDVRRRDDGLPQGVIHAVRVVGDGRPRRRMKSPTESIATPEAGGVLLMTGEERLTVEHSTYERTLTLTHARDDVDLALLTELQAVTPEMTAWMYAFVEWVEDRYEEFEAELPKELRREISNCHIEGSHARLPRALATLLVAARTLLRFAVSLDVINDLEAEEFETFVRDGLLEAGRQHVRSGEHSKPEDSFLAYIAEGHSSGSAQFIDLPRGKGADDSAANVIGYIDSTCLYLRHDRVFTFVRAEAKAQGEPLRATNAQIIDNLIARGIVLPGSEKGRMGMYRLPASVHPKRPRVWRLPLTKELVEMLGLPELRIVAGRARGAGGAR